MTECLKKLRAKVAIGTVGGSDMPKQKEQLGDGCLNDFDYNFAENGVVAHKAGSLQPSTSFSGHIGEDNYKRLVNFILGYLAKVDIPVKRGTFVEYRMGMINVSPIGRSCSREERNAFEEYDLQHKIRATMVEALRKEFMDMNLTFSIGGQISFDIFPTGWDKTYCLRYLDEYDTIHFFGDKTFEGGNDYEIFNHPRTLGHTVTSPEDTMKQLQALFSI
eukprot:GEMP01034828.1.p1 GENE.GEMP01034828.1~~GEMP01034828.1.p1  ORF type:complete len:219 (+),score=41.30 GEMP01034828.1:216-872(+)